MEPMKIPPTIGKDHQYFISKHYNLLIVDIELNAKDPARLYSVAEGLIDDPVETIFRSAMLR